MKIFEKSECAAEEKYRLLSSQDGGDLPIPDWGRDRSILSSGCSVPCADIIYITITYIIIIYCAGCVCVCCVLCKGVEFTVNFEQCMASTSNIEGR